MTNAYSSLNNPELLAEVTRLARREREATAQLIASLVELDSRKLYLGEGFSSLFTYCTQALRLSEGAAYGRIQAARAAKQFPVILELLAEGSLNVTTVGLLAPHLTDDNHRTLLEAARSKSKRDVELQVAALRPRPDVPSSVRRLPAPKLHDMQPPVPDGEVQVQQTANVVRPSPQVRPAVVAPLAAERYQITVTVGRETHGKLRRAQDLLRHVVPNGDPAAILDRALTVLLADLERTKHAASTRPRSAKPCGARERPEDGSPNQGPREGEERRMESRSRRIPAAIKRAVWERDRGRCAFVGTHGRCQETGLLEYHHVVPFALGGKADVDGIELRCAAHNRFEAERYFGPRQPWLVRERTVPWAVGPPV